MSKIICVLGMHRSGTSCLCGLLEDLDVFLGNVSRSNRYNKKGNQENRRIVQLNDSILTYNGSTWNSPPKETIKVSEEHIKSIRRIYSEEYAAKPIVGFKDPRTIFTLPAWRKAMPDMLYLGTFRNPYSVALSLKKRTMKSKSLLFKKRQRWDLERFYDLWLK